MRLRISSLTGIAETQRAMTPIASRIARLRSGGMHIH
jgi:hypothetical protein